MNFLYSIKKTFTTIFILALLVFSLSACGSSNDSNTSSDSVLETTNISFTAQSASEKKETITDTEGTEEHALDTEASNPETSNTEVLNADEENSDNRDIILDENGMINVNITIGNQVFAAKFYNNESARAIISEMPFTLEMDDYASQEKVKGLIFDLPSASRETPATINTGDIYLWSGNSLVLFYTTFSNSYSYVPVGYIVDVAGLTDALGSGSCKLSFTL